MMTNRASQFVILMLLGVCVAAAGLLSAQRATARLSNAGGGIAHLCLGDMDLNFQNPVGQRRMWVGEHDDLQLKGCTYPESDFETMLPGTRYVVAGTFNKQNSVVAYVNSEPPLTAMATAVSELQRGGYDLIRGDSGKGGIENFQLLHGSYEQLQLIGVPFVHNQSLLIVVRTSTGKSTGEQR